MSEQIKIEQNVIAMIWDFDRTLSPIYMQQPIFDHYGVDAATFWKEVNALEAHYAVDGIHVNKDTVYLNHMLTYVQQGIFEGLNNAKLAELGEQITFFPGMPDFFKASKQAVQDNPEFQIFDLKLEHYIVSTGLSAMINGSSIAADVDGVWGCEFIEDPYLSQGGELVKAVSDKPLISQIAVTMDNTMKTKPIFEINKGANKYPQVDVNSPMADEGRRVPFQQMIYIADGPSDVPAFSLVTKHGGKAFAVYDEASDKSFEQANALVTDKRVNLCGPANYAEGSHTYRWLMLQVKQMGETIIAKKKAALSAVNKGVPKHLSE